MSSALARPLQLISRLGRVFQSFPGPPGWCAQRGLRGYPVLSGEEVRRLPAVMDGVHGVLARALHGTGMRLMECVRPRVKNVDFERSRVTVRDDKGGKDRRTLLAGPLRVPLQKQLATGLVPWRAGREAPRRVSLHTLRHPFATHLPESGHDIRTMQELPDPTRTPEPPPTAGKR